MANVTQTDQNGAQYVGSTPRDADDSSDKFTSGGAYDHNAVDYSATVHGELVSRWLYLERRVMAQTWAMFRCGV